MSPRMLILTGVFLAFNIIPNGARKPIIKGLEYENKDVNLFILDRITDKKEEGQKQRNSGDEEIDDTKLLSLLEAIKRNQRVGFENGNGLSMLHAVDQVDMDGYDKIFENRDKNLFLVKSESYEDRNDNNLYIRDSRSEDRDSVEAQNAGVSKILALLLLNDQSGQNYPFESQSHLPSSESNRNKEDNYLIKDLEYYIRSGVWKSCGKKASKVCKKACKEAIKNGCSGSSCKSKARKRMKRDCKSACKDRFDVGASC